MAVYEASHSQAHSHAEAVADAVPVALCMRYDNRAVRSPEAVCTLRTVTPNGQAKARAARTASKPIATVVAIGAVERMPGPTAVRQWRRVLPTLFPLAATERCFMCDRVYGAT